MICHLFNRSIKLKNGLRALLISSLDERGQNDSDDNHRVNEQSDCSPGDQRVIIPIFFNDLKSNFIGICKIVFID